MLWGWEMLLLLFANGEMVRPHSIATSAACMLAHHELCLPAGHTHDTKVPC